MNEENIKRLDAWYEMVKGEKELTIEEARILNNQIRKLPPNERELREKLILGTLHVVYSFLKYFSFLELTSATHDIDDLINSVCEVWIENLEQGLYRRSDFFELFNSKFFDKLNEKLGIQEKNSLFPHITKLDFDDIFFDFFDSQNAGETIEYEDFMKKIERYNHIRNLNVETIHSLNYEYTALYKLLNKSYEIYSRYGKHNIPYSKGYVKFLRDFLVEKALEDYEDSYNVGYVYDGCDIVIEKEKKEAIRSVLDTYHEREKYVLMLSFGFIDGDKKTQQEIAEYFEGKWTRQRIQQIEKKVKKNLLHPSRRKKLKDYVTD